MKFDYETSLVEIPYTYATITHMYILKHLNKARPHSEPKGLPHTKWDFQPVSFLGPL